MNKIAVLSLAVVLMFGLLAAPSKRHCRWDRTPIITEDGSTIECPSLYYR